jgi:hypothetical protein
MGWPKWRLLVECIYFETPDSLYQTNPQIGDTAFSFGQYKLQPFHLIGVR